MSSSGGGTLVTIAGYLGNVVEWYDFAIYGFFSDAIAQAFFPPSDSAHANLVLSYVVFGGAFLARPLGGVLTGHIGDKFGRKRALVFSLSTMTVPTVAMGCLPTYAQVGGWSTALLVICRLLQGFSVGGQLLSSLVYSLESKPREHWGYYGSLVAFSACMGSVLGNLTGALIHSLLTEDQLVSWGWRLAFLTGSLVGPVAAFVHFFGVEINPNEGEFAQEGSASSTSQGSPLKEAFQKDNRWALLAALLTPMLASAGWYITFVWMAIYMSKLIDPPVEGAFWLNLLAALVGHNTTAIGAGWLSDRYGRTKLMLTGVIGVAVLAPVFLWIISWGRTVDAFFSQWALGVTLSLYVGPLFSWLPERFPAKTRLTSVGLGYNLGVCISAGFSPAVATALSRDYGPVAPGAIYPFFAILTLIGMLASTKIPRQGGGDEHDLIHHEERTQLERTLV